MQYKDRTLQDKFGKCAIKFCVTKSCSGNQTLQTQDSSDPKHLGTTLVGANCLDTSALMPHFGPKCRSVLPLGPKCPDTRSEVSRPILLNCVERFYLFVSYAVCLPARTSSAPYRPLQTSPVLERVCKRLLCYGCAASLWMFPVMGSLEACCYRPSVTATPLEHHAQTNTHGS